MRTTVHLPDDLLAEAKKLAADSRTTLTALIEDSLREAVVRRARRPRSKPLRLTTFGRSGLRPGVDLDDSAGLLDVMEGRA